MSDRGRKVEEEGEGEEGGLVGGLWAHLWDGDQVGVVVSQEDKEVEEVRDQLLSSSHHTALHQPHQLQHCLQESVVTV